MQMRQMMLILRVYHAGTGPVRDGGHTGDVSKDRGITGQRSVPGHAPRLPGSTVQERLKGIGGTASDKVATKEEAEIESCDVFSNLTFIHCTT